MKKSIVILLTSLCVAGNATAETVDNTQKTGAKKELNTMINSLSNLLAATNPKGQGAAPQGADYQQRLQSLPPLNPTGEQVQSAPTAAIRSQPMVLPQPTVQPKVQPVAEAIDEPKLAPETKRILRSSGNRMADREVYKKEQLVMQRGKFDPEDGAYKDNLPVLEKIETPSEPAKPRFEVEVQNVRNPQSEGGLLTKGLSALRAGQYEAAIASYKAALMKDGKSRDALFGLATAYHKAGQKAQAKAAYAKLLSVHPKFEPGWNNFMVLAADEAPQDALNELNNMSTRNPNFAPIYAQKAAIYTKLGNTAKVRENYIKALNLDPNNITYKYNLAVLLDQTGEGNAAIKLYSELLELSYKGQKLPVTEEVIRDRMNLISSNVNS